MNNPPVPSLLARAERHAHAHPDKPFVIISATSGTTTLTYGELWSRAGRYAAGLSGAGVVAGDVVPIVLPYSVDVYAIFVGVMMLGAQPCIMPPHTPKQDEAAYYSAHAQLFERIAPRRIVMSPALQHLYAQNLPELAPRLADPAGILAPAARQLAAIGASTAFLQFSSGTTALKKGVLLSHLAVEAQCERYAAAIGATGDDVIVSWLPLYHDMGLLACFILPLWSGATIVGMDNYEWLARPRRILDLTAEYRGTLMWLPNFAFNYLAQRVRGDAGDLSSLRAVINCSEPCRPSSHHAFEERFIPWGLKPGTSQTCYAMAEATYAVTQSTPGAPPAELVVDALALEAGSVREPGEGAVTALISSGRPLRDFVIRIVDEGGAALGDNAVGEILIRGPSMADGYFRDPDLTSERFQSDGFYRSRDLGFMRDGELYVLGRSDDVIIVFGRKLRAPELEASLGVVPGIKSGRVIVVAQDSAEIGTNEVFLLYETDDGTIAESTVAADARRIMLAETGLSFRQVLRVAPGSLIKTTSGKLSRPANTRLLEQLMATGRA